MMDYKRCFLGRSVFLFIMSLLCFGQLISCSGGSNTSQGAILRGEASAGNPVTDAKLAVYDVEGRLIYKSDNAVTGNYGAFIVGVNGLPSDFRVVAAGGNLEGEAFADISADCRNFNANTGMVYINLVTTMVSAYMDRHPGRPLDEATTAVKNYLAIPQSMDIGSELPNEYFSSMSFIEEAKNNGGVSKYISQLVAEVDSGAQHPFVGPPIVGGGTGGGFGSWLAEKLAAGAVSYIGGQGMGWGLSELGWGDDTQSQMLGMLGQISQQITQLQNRMTQMQQQLNAVDYNVIVSSLGTLPSDIQTLHDRLQIFVSVTPTEENRIWRDKEKAAIQTLISQNIMLNTDAIHNAMMGNGFAGGGLIVKWSKVVAGQHHFFKYQDSKMQTDMFDYWDSLQQIQLELILEYEHSINAPTSVIQAYIDKYNDHYRDEAAIAPRALMNDDRLMVVSMAPGDSGNGLMILPVSMDSPMLINGAVSVIFNLNTNQEDGFTNWQLPICYDYPTDGSVDMRAMFQNPYPSPGVRLRDWLISQGWGEQYLPIWPPDPYDASYWCQSDSLAIGDSMYRFGEYDYRGGYVYVDSTNDISFVLPVRHLASGEFYFYK